MKYLEKMVLPLGCWNAHATGCELSSTEHPLGLPTVMSCLTSSHGYFKSFFLQSFVAIPCFFSKTDQGPQGFLPWGQQESLGNARVRALVCGGHWAVWAVLEQDLHTHWDTWESFKCENLSCLWSSDFIQTPSSHPQSLSSVPSLLFISVKWEKVFVNVQAVVISMNMRQKFPYKPPMLPAVLGPTPLVISKVQRVWDQACGDNITAIIICSENGLVVNSHLVVAARWCGNSWICFFRLTELEWDTTDSNCLSAFF